eukprot:scaffold273065_cov28-Prasinocladus_malaysianus.AAC.1
MAQPRSSQTYSNRPDPACSRRLDPHSAHTMAVGPGKAIRYTGIIMSHSWYSRQKKEMTFPLISYE